MNKYRTHNCGELTKKNTSRDIILSGWVNKKRDHGNLLFIDLRDNYCVTQCVIDKSNKHFIKLEKISAFVKLLVGVRSDKEICNVLDDYVNTSGKQG